jgi:predicted RNase H-like HicB family nuclease
LPQGLQLMSSLEMFTVVASWDEAGEFWIGSCAEIGVLSAKAETLDELFSGMMEKIAQAVEDGEIQVEADSVHMQIVAHRHLMSRA